MSACTVAAIISLLGYMPPKGTVVTIPKESVQQYTVTQQFKAKLCARRYGIKWRIEDNP